MSSSYSNKHVVSRLENPLNSWTYTETMRSSDCENPPHDVLSSGSVVCTTASDFPRNPGSVIERQRARPLTSHMTELVRMDEVVDRLLDPYHRRGKPGGRYPNPYRPSIVQSGNRSDVNLTATWCGELRVQNEALVDESTATLMKSEMHVRVIDACAKEQTLRDLERLTAAGTVTSSGIRGSYNNHQQSSYVMSCSADMRPYALEDDDMRVPSFLRNRTKIPMRRMPVPGMGDDSGSFASSNDDSFLGMGFAPIGDYSNAMTRGPPSVCCSLSSDSTAVQKGKLGGLRNSKVAKCVKGLKSWRKSSKSNHLTKDTPAIKEDRDYDFSEEQCVPPLSTTLLSRTNCLLCWGAPQPSKHSSDTSDETAGTSGESAVASVKSEFKSILLTTSPLYGDMQPTPRSPTDDLVYSTQHSLNIAATHDPVTSHSSDSEDGMLMEKDERDIPEIWDDDESDYDSAIIDDDLYQSRPWNGSFTSTYAPPPLKTDQEYEMYQLQSRMKAETVMRTQLTPQEMSLTSHRYTPEELVDTASLSSWDLKGSNDMSIRKGHVGSRTSSSWSDLGLEAVPSDRNNLHSRIA